MTQTSTSQTKSSDYEATRTILVHGIMTSAKWQKTASEVLNDQAIRFKIYDFDKYGLHKYLQVGK
jgi:hypothetical protein